jgi:hypothetical protein
MSPFQEADPPTQANASMPLLQGASSLLPSGGEKVSHRNSDNRDEMTSEKEPSESSNRDSTKQNEMLTEAKDSLQFPTNNAPPKPLFILHIGPHKTATSSLQCELARYREELYQNASLLYLGRTYNHCLKQSRLPRIDTRDIIDCFKHGRCENAQVWKRLESYLSRYSESNKSIILSDEAFARMKVQGGDGVDNRELLHRLVDKYYPGRMRVVILYRRYFEWFLSMWNEGAKPFRNNHVIPGHGSPYKEQFEKWPGEGGVRSATFASHLAAQESVKKICKDCDYNSRNNDTCKVCGYQQLANANNVHVATYLSGLWSNHSDEIIVLNYHGSDGGDDVTVRFLTAIDPAAAESYLRVKDADFTGRPNPSRNIEYDRIAVAAYESGLLGNETNIPRFKVSELIEKHLLHALNTTMDRLPFHCPDETDLQHFLQMSLDYERQMFLNQSDEIAEQHKQSFNEAVVKRKFCSVNCDKLVEDDSVKAFFATIRHLS